MSTKRCPKCNSLIVDGNVCPCCGIDIYKEEQKGNYIKDIPRQSSLSNICLLCALNTSFVLLMINAVFGKILWCPYPIMFLLGICIFINAVTSRSIKKLIAKLRNGLMLLLTVTWIVAIVMILANKSNSSVGWIFSYLTPLSCVAMILLTMFFTFLGKIDLKSVIFSLFVYMVLSLVPIIYILVIKLTQITPIVDLIMPDKMGLIIISSAFGVTFLSLLDIGYIYLSNYKEYPDDD